jgi:hypothetical protein
MQVRFAFVFIALCLFQACKQDTKSPSGQKIVTPANDRFNPLYGNWITIDFCSGAAEYGSVLTAMNNRHKPYAYAFTFNDNNRDSITCYNGIETWKRRIRFEADTLVEVLDARNGKSVFLSYSPSGNQDITLFDGTMGRSTTNRMIKSADSQKTGYEAFQIALNHNLMGGNFVSVGKSSGKVVFLPTGEVSGLEGYDHYEICTGGDCFIAAQTSDVIMLSNTKTQSLPKYFGFKFENERSSLTISELTDATPAEKGSAKVGAAVYRLKRSK